MKSLHKLSKDLRSYFLSVAMRGVGIWLGTSLLGALLMYYLVGFLSLSGIQKDVGFLVIVLAGVVQAAVHVTQVYGCACKAAKEAERKEAEKPL